MKPHRKAADAGNVVAQKLVLLYNSFMNEDEILLTTKQVAIRKGVTVTTVLRWIRLGYIPGAQLIGRDWIIPESSLDKIQPKEPGRPKDGSK